MKLHLSWAACDLLLVLSLAACGGADTLILPDASEVTAVRVTAGGAVTLHRDPAWIQSFLTEATEAAEETLSLRWTKVSIPSRITGIKENMPLETENPAGREDATEKMEKT